MKVVGQQIRNDLTQIGDADRAKRARTDGPAGAEVDSVKISESVGEAKASLAADSAAASERVARIKADIESGGYPIDFEKLAEKIIDDELGRWL